ncbi:MFS transporter [Streptomyces johnsoniae]|uniref:MFS transporter n=1 Tax=Streptomyces johnsoniae TaxID=3075532 RepID=A0ABU2SCJ3_9ACTN|nr:MFS transporter [Streptomyces sp. DSM 41886]MDT0445425.1 MFS transporter [Streptomyces sp. DSM 41886]
MHELRRKAMLDLPGFPSYLLSRALTMFGATMAPVALAFAVLHTTASASSLGLVLAAQTAPQVVFLLVGGAIGDRASRKTIMVATNLVMALSQAATACLLVLGDADLVLLMILQAIWGIARAFFTPANTAVVPDLVPAERIQDATALVTLSRSIAFICGPAVAGGLIVVWNPGFIVLGDALFFLVSAALLARLPLKRPVAAPEENLRQSLITGWREFAGRSWVWSMVSSFGFYQGVVRPAIFVVGPVLAAGEDGMGASAWGLVIAAQGVGSLLGSLLLFWWRPSRPLLASNLLVGLDSLFLLGLALTFGFGPLALLAVFGAAGVTTADALWLSTLQREIPSDALSRVSSYEWIGSLALNPLGMAVTGLLVTVVGPATILVTAAVANFVVRALVVFAPGVRRIGNPARKKKAPDDVRAPDPAAAAQS